MGSASGAASKADALLAVSGFTACTDAGLNAVSPHGLAFQLGSRWFCGLVTAGALDVSGLDRASRSSGKLHGLASDGIRLEVEEGSPVAAEDVEGFGGLENSASPFLDQASPSAASARIWLIASWPIELSLLAAPDKAPNAEVEN